MKKLLLFAAALGVSVVANATDKPAWTTSVGSEISVFEAAGDEGDETEEEAVPSSYITETPAGTETLWVRNSNGFTCNSLGRVSGWEDYGEVVRMIVAEDGTTVYLNNPLASRDCEGWLKGTMDAAGNISMTFPQCIHKYNGYYFYAVCLKSNAETNTLTPAENQTFKLVKGNIGYTCEDPMIILGLCELFDGEDNLAQGNWDGFGIFNYAMFAQTDSEVVPPADLETEEWAFIDGHNGWRVKVGFTADKAYIQGACAYSPNAWIAGDINGNEVTFKTAYVGVCPSMRHYAYLHPAMGLYQSLSTYGAPQSVYSFADKVVLTYDAEKKTLMAPTEVVPSAMYGDCPIGWEMNGEAGTFMFHSVPVADSPAYQIQLTIAPRMKEQKDDANLPPMNPIFTRVTDYIVDYGQGSMRYVIPVYDTEYNLLDPNKLFYNILVNGEPYTIETADYPFFPQDYTDIPAQFGEGVKMKYNYTHHTFYYNFRDWETVGLQSIYKDGENERRSEIVTYPSTTSVASIAVGNDVKATEYYDLSGRKVVNPEKGMYVRVSKMADGSRKSEKVTF